MAKGLFYVPCARCGGRTIAPDARAVKCSGCKLMADIENRARQRAADDAIRCSPYAPDMVVSGIGG